MQSTHRFSRSVSAPFLGMAGLITLSLATRPAAAQATTYFPSDTTINYAVPGDAFVGFNTSLVPSSPTVNIATGGLINGILEVYNSSIVNLSGGTVSDILWAMNTSTINVSGGLVDSYLYATQGSTFHVSGGTFGQYQGVSFADVTTGTFNFVGSGLSFAPDPSGQTPFGGTDYTLTGWLQNGQSVTGDVIDVAPGATMFTLTNGAPVPEASTASLLAFGTLCIAGLVLPARRKGRQVTRRRIS